jgi:chromosome partitioning protein
MTALRKQYKRLLKSYIPFSTDIEKMGVHRAPLLTFAAKEEAAEAYRKIWDAIEKKARIRG